MIQISSCFFLVVMPWPVVPMLAELDQRSQAANFPMVIPQAAMPIGFVLMGLLIAAALIARAAGAQGAGEPPHGH